MISAVFGYVQPQAAGISRTSVGPLATAVPGATSRKLGEGGGAEACGHPTAQEASTHGGPALSVRSLTPSGVSRR